MATISELVQSTVKSMQQDTKDRVSEANVQLQNDIIQEVKTTVVPEMVQEQVGTDLSNLATKDDVATKVDTSKLFRNDIFYVKQEDTDGSYNIFWQELNSGGGNQYYNSKTNTISYAGVNKNPGFDENGQSKSVDVQLYAKDKTSNIGTRINITAKEGMFYLKNSTNIGFPADREVAVIGDISALAARITELEARVAQLENN